MRFLLCSLSFLLLSAARAADTAPANSDPFAGNACVECHRDLPGRLGEITNMEWQRSVHYAGKVGCEGCHGGNAALRRGMFTSDDEFKRAAHLARSPEFLLMLRDKEFVGAARGRSVSYLCGKCHSQTKEKHLGSPHGDFGNPTCLYCHGQGSHLIPPASVNIIDTRSREQNGRCSPCHRAATMKSVERIKQMLTDSEERIKTSAAQYKELEASGYHNIELEQRHHHAAEAQAQLRQVFHSFNVRDVTKIAADIQAVAERTEASHQLIQRLRQVQRQQTILGALVMAILLSFAALLLYYKRTFLDHEHAAAASAPSAPGTDSDA